MPKGVEIPLPLEVIEVKVKQGFNDAEIGKDLGVPKGLIRRRRLWLHLPANKRKYPELKSPLTKVAKYGFASLTEEEKQFVREYKEAHNIKNRPARLEAQRRYFREWRLHRSQYLGTRICRKCGKKGYASLRSQINTKTGYVYRQIAIEHRRGTQYLYTCYVSKEDF